MAAPTGFHWIDEGIIIDEDDPGSEAFRVHRDGALCLTIDNLGFVTVHINGLKVNKDTELEANLLVREDAKIEGKFGCNNTEPQEPFSMTTGGVSYYPTSDPKLITTVNMICEALIANGILVS